MSDHFSGPAVIGDPAVDLTDFYAFPSPERAGNLVLIMNVFPLATSRSHFSDVLTYRFRLRPLTPSGASIGPGTAEYSIEVTFDDLQDDALPQKATINTSDRRKAEFPVGMPFEQDGMRVFAGLVSDPFFMDVEAALRTTDIVGKLDFKKEGTNTVQYRDVLSIAVEIPFGAIVEQFGGNTLIGALAENTVTRRGKAIRIERLGRPEIKNFVLANASRDPHTKGVELRDLYNKEDAFALSRDYRALYESRFDANLAFFDNLDGQTAWPLGPDGHHPLRDLLIDDVLIVDLAHGFAPGLFLEIERAMLEDRPHESAGGRWLDDDILDEMLTLFVNGGHGERLGDGVDGPSKLASHSFPYVREPNNRTDLPLPAFLGGPST
jgi:hypothetical protein